jgi:limonene-1,2-epoxide hydrolase
MLQSGRIPKEDTMTATAAMPEDVVQAFLAAMERMDYDAGLAHVANDVEYINGPNAPRRGHQGIREELEPFFAPIVENRFIVQRQAKAGNVVFIERLDRHRIPQGWFELPVTGVFEVHDGKITWWREYFDRATVVEGMTKLLQGAK